MAIHDAYARLTPYELLLPDPEFADRHFPAVEEEAGERGVDTGNPAAFVMLGAVQGTLAELRTDDTGPEAAHDHGSVLYFAYHMWLAGPAVALVRVDTVRRLLFPDGNAPSTADQPTHAHDTRNTDDAWTAALRERSGYVQLPQHLVWLEEGDDDSPGDPPPPAPAEPHPAEPAGGSESPPGTSPAPESVDGFFWAVDPGGIVHLALVTGVRGDRPGYGVVSVPPQPLSALPGWAGGPAREGGGDFMTSLPGADLDGLLSVRTPAEVFKLAALLLGRMVRDQPALHPPRAAADATPGSPSGADQPPTPGPTPTSLPSALL